MNLRKKMPWEFFHPANVIVIIIIFLIAIAEVYKIWAGSPMPLSDFHRKLDMHFSEITLSTTLAVCLLINFLFHVRRKQVSPWFKFIVIWVVIEFVISLLLAANFTLNFLDLIQELLFSVVAMFSLLKGSTIELIAGIVCFYLFAPFLILNWEKSRIVNPVE